jgi:hypothetical protein
LFFLLRPDLAPTLFQLCLAGQHDPAFASLDSVGSEEEE